jgi:tetratricopeptide (TPR) repeat protein
VSAVLEKRLLLILLVFSAAVRLTFFLELKDTDLAAVPMLDSATYYEWAASLVEGDWGWYETYWMGPLYPHLLAVVYVIFGVGSQSALALQLVLSWLNILLLHRFALRALDDTPAAREISLLAAALFALYGAPVFYAGNLLMATLVTTLLLLVAHQTLRALRDPTWRSWLTLGLATGLTGLARGNVLLLLPLLPLLLLKTPPPQTGAFSVRLKLVAALWLGGALMLAPVTLRNLLIADDFVILTSNGGVNLLIGQQAAFKGLFAPVMDEVQAEFDLSMESTLERELGRDLKGSEVSRILTRRAWKEFSENLSDMPLLYARKIYRFWNGYELPQVVSYDYYKRVFKSLWLLPVPYVIISAFGLAGFWFLPRRARWVLLVLVGGFFLSLLPFFPTSRYRQPVAPLLALSAAAWLVAMWRQPHRRRLWLPVGAGLVIALLPTWTAMDPAEVLWQVHLREASRAGVLNNLNKALAKGRLAEEVRPGLADTPFQVSIFLEELDEREQAIEYLHIAASRAPSNRLVPYRIGRNYEELGRVDEAMEAFAQSVALDSTWSYPWLRGGLLLNKAGRKQEALRAMQKAYELAPGSQRVRSNLAALYAESGELVEAHRLLSSLTRDYPLYVHGWFNRALVEYQAGRLEQARNTLEVARGLPGLTDQERLQIAQLMRQIEAADPR